jgi:hypothetical protein
MAWHACHGLLQRGMFALRRVQRQGLHHGIEKTGEVEG